MEMKLDRGRAKSDVEGEVCDGILSGDGREGLEIYFDYFCS